jgi:hypothetical protein
MKKIEYKEEDLEYIYKFISNNLNPKIAVPSICNDEFSEDENIVKEVLQSGYSARGVILHDILTMINNMKSEKPVTEHVRSLT